MTFRAGYQNYRPDLGANPPIRRIICTDGTCKTCNELRPGDLAPPHDASARCESNKRSHCSCDICF